MSKTDKYDNIIVGIGFYKREDWERLLASAIDKEKLEDSYDEWLKDFRKAVKNMRSVGITLREKYALPLMNSLIIAKGMVLKTMPR